MKNNFFKLRELIAVAGFWRTCAYLLNIVPERCGFGIIRIFLYDREARLTEIASERSFKIIKGMDQLADTQIDSLRHYRGEKICSHFEKLFQRGCYCAIGCIKEQLGCVCWTFPLKNRTLLKGKTGFIIRQSFTLPSMRGKGLYPATLNFLCDYLEKQYREDLKIFIESTIFNYSALRSIEKTGFRKVGIALMFFGLRIYLPS